MEEDLFAPVCDQPRPIGELDSRTFGAIGKAMLKLERVEFRLHEAVEETIEIFAARAHAKGLELACAGCGSPATGVAAASPRASAAAGRRDNAACSAGWACG